MLLILFSIGEYEYALDTKDVVEIVPAINLRPLVGTPTYVKGVFNYRNHIIPVIDLTDLTINKASKKRLNTRILIINYMFKKDYKSFLGLMAEHMTDILEVTQEALLNTGVCPSSIPHLGKVINFQDKIIQCIELENLLNEKIKHELFLKINENKKADS